MFGFLKWWRALIAEATADGIDDGVRIVQERHEAARQAAIEDRSEEERVLPDHGSKNGRGKSRVAS